MRNRNRFMTSIAVLTILAGTGGAFGQGMGTKEAPSGTPTQRSPSATPEPGGQMNRGQSPEINRSAPHQDSTRSGEIRGQSSGDRTRSNEPNNAGKNGNAERSGAERGGERSRSETRSQTTGQAGAGAKLTTEQRTKITSVIREQRVQPETNVNFNIAVGTHVPKTVHFHALPQQIITLYPDWRGYEFFLVRDQIVVVNPRTLEIVAVLEA